MSSVLIELLHLRVHAEPAQARAHALELINDVLQLLVLGEAVRLLLWRGLLPRRLDDIGAELLQSVVALFEAIFNLKNALEPLRYPLIMGNVQDSP